MWSTAEPVSTEPVPPQPGEVWRHYKGGRYIVLHLAVREDSGLLVVVYRSLEGSVSVWVRDLWQWQQKVKTEAGWVLRFAREEAQAC